MRDLTPSPLRYYQAEVAGDIAIIGGGIAGLTVAAALAMLCDHVRRITVFESHNFLHLQLNHGNKWIHPTIYDWPDVGSDLRQVDALLPLMSWSAGEQHEVAKQIMYEFLRIVRSESGRIELKEYCRVTRPELSPEGVTVSWESDSRIDSRRFDRAILAIGFGIEHDSERSYWNPSIYLTGYDVAAKPLCIGICGNGDSALVEFIAAALLPWGHHEILRYFDENINRDIREKLIEIESTAWKDGGAYFNFPSAYSKLLDIDALKQKVARALRKNISIVCINRADRKFLHKNATSILNRLLAWLICATSSQSTTPFVQKLEYNNTKLKPREIESLFYNNIDTGKHTVRFFLRTGSNRNENQRDFSFLLQNAIDSVAHRPQTPRLSLPAQLAYLRQTERNRARHYHESMESCIDDAVAAIKLRVRPRNRSITWIWSSRPDQAQFVAAAAIGRLADRNILRIPCRKFVDKDTAIKSLSAALASPCALV